MDMDTMNTMYLPVGAFNNWKLQERQAGQYDTDPQEAWTASQEAWAAWAAKNASANSVPVQYSSLTQPIPPNDMSNHEEDKSCFACAKAFETQKDWETMMISFVCPIGSALSTASLWDEVRAYAKNDPIQARYDEGKQKCYSASNICGCCGYATTASAGIFLLTKIPDVGFISLVAGLAVISVFPVSSICYLSSKVHETYRMQDDLPLQDRSKIHTPNCIKDFCCLMWCFPCYNTYLWKTGSEDVSQVKRKRNSSGN